MRRVGTATPCTLVQKLFCALLLHSLLICVELSAHPLVQHTRFSPPDIATNTSLAAVLSPNTFVKHYVPYYFVSSPPGSNEAHLALETPQLELAMFHGRSFSVGFTRTGRADNGEGFALPVAKKTQVRPVCARVQRQDTGNAAVGVTDLWTRKRLERGRDEAGRRAGVGEIGHQGLSKASSE